MKKEMKIIDFHVHLGDIFKQNNTFDLIGKGISYESKPNFFELIRFNNIHFGGLNHLAKPLIALKARSICMHATFSNLKNSMELNNISKSVVLALEPNVKSMDIINLAKLDNRTIPFCSLDPKCIDFLDRLRLYKKSGAKGVKFHPVLQNINPNSDKALLLFDSIQKVKLPVLCHTGWDPIGISKFGSLSLFQKLVEEYPRITFIMAHLGMYEPHRAISFGQNYSNVHFDLSWQPKGNIRMAVERLGSHRFLFGSDWPFALQTTSLDLIRAALDDKKELGNVLYKNAAKILDLEA